MIKQTRLFTLWGCVAGLAFSQTTPAPTPLTVQVQTLSTLARAIEGLYWLPGREWTPLNAPSEFLPPAVAYTGPNPIQFYRKEQPVDAENEPRYVPVIQALIPEDSDQVILLFSERGERVVASVVPLREQNFPVGSYMVFNQSGRGLVMILEEKPLHLASGAVQVVSPDNKERGPVPVVLRFTKDGDNVSLITSTWFYHPERRRLVFLFEDQEQIQVRGITWYPGTKK